MSPPTLFWFWKRIQSRLMTSYQAQNTCFAFTLSRMKVIPAATAPSWISRHCLLVSACVLMCTQVFVCHGVCLLSHTIARYFDAFVIGSGWHIKCFFYSSTAESQTQNSSMVMMGAIAGGGVMLLIVVVILLLHKRFGKLSSTPYPQFLSLSHLFRISQLTDSVQSNAVYILAVICNHSSTA